MVLGHLVLGTCQHLYSLPVNTLATLSISVVAGGTTTQTKVASVTGQLQEWTLYYKVGTALVAPTVFNSSIATYTALTLNSNIACVAGNKIVVVAYNGTGICATSASTNVVVGS